MEVWRDEEDSLQYAVLGGALFGAAWLKAMYDSGLYDANLYNELLKHRCKRGIAPPLLCSLVHRVLLEIYAVGTLNLKASGSRVQGSIGPGHSWV